MLGNSSESIALGPEVVQQTTEKIKLIQERMRAALSYPNFVRGPLLDDMQLLFGPCKVLGTHH